MLCAVCPPLLEQHFWDLLAHCAIAFTTQSTKTQDATVALGSMSSAQDDEPKLFHFVPVADK